MPKVKVGDIEMYYEIYGTGEPVIVINGAGGAVDPGNPVFSPLAKECQVVVFDNRGNGRTDAPQTPYTIEGFADDTAGLMAALGLRSASVIGFSMGGMIAQELALRHPQRIRALVLCGAGIGGREGVIGPLARDAMDAQSAHEKQPDNPNVLLALIKFTLAPVTMETRPDFVADHLRFRLNLPKVLPHVNTLQRKAIGSWPGSYSRLSQIRVPTLVMTGDQDVVVVPENARILHEGIAGSELRIIPNTGHMFPFEAPEATNEAILSFLRRVAKG